MTPRLWTPPLRELTPETSYGFDLIDFARDVVGTPLDPWEQWVAIHAGELLPDGRPRFRTVLIIVARQNGKTLLAKIMTLFWMFVEGQPLVLGCANKLGYAKISWSSVIAMAKGNDYLKPEVGPIRHTIGEECFTTTAGAEYRIAASNKDAGRSLTVTRLLLDELRSHADFSAWDAATNALNAVPYGQTVAITNQGDDTSVVLDSLRNSALEHLETGQGDPRLGIFEYSAPDGSRPTDLEALAQANPNLGYRLDVDALMGAARRAEAAGGEELTGFLTEVMCMRVRQLDPAVDPTAWEGCGTDEPLDLAGHRERVALCLDVALDGSHATLAAAAVLDGVTHVEIVEQWLGYGCTKALRADLPGLIDRIRPRTVGWFPQGPGAAVAADLTTMRLPRRVELAEIRAETTQVTMGFADAVLAGEVQHPDDPMLNSHIASAAKQWRGDAWVFGRKGRSPIDGAYAAAGATHLARTLPPAPPPLVAL